MVSNHLKKYVRQIGFHFPRDRGENKKCLKPPSRICYNDIKSSGFIYHYTVMLFTWNIYI